MYFAYVHARPDTVDAAGIFYVGKGNLRRVRDRSDRNRFHGFVMNKHGKDNILIGTLPCSSESIAFDLEIGLIKCLRRKGVVLTNMTDGGEGSSGASGSEKQKAFMREYNKSFTSEQRKAARAKEPINTDEKRSTSLKEYYATRDETAKLAKGAKCTESNNRTWADPEVRARRIAGMQGKKKTMTEAAIQARRNNLKKGKV